MISFRHLKFKITNLFKGNDEKIMFAKMDLIESQATIDEIQSDIEGFKSNVKLAECFLNLEIDENNGLKSKLKDLEFIYYTRTGRLPK